MRNVLALLADWANGIFSIFLAVLVTGNEAAWWHFLVGVLLSHLPDLDALPELWQRGKVAASSENPYDHRQGLHYPMAILLIALLLVWQLGYWGWVIFFSFLLHYSNDLYGTGWGIKLFWPFSSRNYKFFTRRVNRLKRLLITSGDWELVAPTERRLQFVVSWSAEELPTYFKRWGIENWISEYYLKPNPICLTEYLLFGMAVVGMVWYLLR
jgi:LexA-binding, inner membrane-associated putative hydrolase